jgi:hypothetical protein
VQYHAEDADQPGLDEVIDKLLAATWKAKPETGLAEQVRRAVDSVVLYHLMALAANENAPAQVRATAFFKLNTLRDWLNNSSVPDDSLIAFRQFSAAQIKRFLDNPKQISVPRPPEAPPGQPIGDFEY